MHLDPLRLHVMRYEDTPMKNLGLNQRSPKTLGCQRETWVYNFKENIRKRECLPLCYVQRAFPEIPSIDVGFCAWLDVFDSLNRRRE